MLEVIIYDKLGKETARFAEENDTDIDYVSLVSNETYGPPALIAPARGREEARAAVDDRVLYIMTGENGPAMFRVVRTSN